MTEPCTQEENIIRIGRKVDDIHDMVVDIRLQNQRIETLEAIKNDHEYRIRKIEKTPIRVVWGAVGLSGTVIAAWVTRALWG